MWLCWLELWRGTASGDLKPVTLLYISGGIVPQEKQPQNLKTWTVFSGRGGGGDGVVLTDSYVSMTGKSQRIIMPGHQEMRSSAWKKEVTHITENS